MPAVRSAHRLVTARDGSVIGGHRAWFSSSVECDAMDLGSVTIWLATTVAVLTLSMNLIDVE